MIAATAWCSAASTAETRRACTPSPSPRAARGTPSPRRRSAPSAWRSRAVATAMATAKRVADGLTEEAADRQRKQAERRMLNALARFHRREPLRHDIRTDALIALLREEEASPRPA